MLYTLTSAQDPLTRLFVDDPVRPQIPTSFRCHPPDNLVFVLLEQDQAQAVLCCSFKSHVPSTDEELLKFEYAAHRNAIFYTVWSYGAGAGRKIIPQAQRWIQQHYPHITGFYTYSPPGQRVRDFHYSLGASLYRTNSTSINYQYQSL